MVGKYAKYWRQRISQYCTRNASENEANLPKAKKLLTKCNAIPDGRMITEFMKKRIIPRNIRIPARRRIANAKQGSIRKKQRIILLTWRIFFVRRGTCVVGKEPALGMREANSHGESKHSLMLISSLGFSEKKNPNGREAAMLTQMRTRANHHKEMKIE